MSSQKPSIGLTGFKLVKPKLINLAFVLGLLTSIPTLGFAATLHGIKFQNMDADPVYTAGVDIPYVNHQVMIRNQTTGVVLSAVTDANGAYTINNIAGGSDYTISVSFPDNLCLVTSTAPVSFNNETDVREMNFGFGPCDEELKTACEDPTNFTLQNGAWNDPSIWASGEVPKAGDRVLIETGHEVLLEGEINLVDGGICNLGTLYSNDGAFTGCGQPATPGQDIVIFAREVFNGEPSEDPNNHGAEGAIIAGKGASAPYPDSGEPCNYPRTIQTCGDGVTSIAGKGGNVEIYATKIFSNGRIESGDGGDASAAHAHAVAGDGGVVKLVAEPHLSSSTRPVVSGAGGKTCGNSNRWHVRSGRGGDVVAMFELLGGTWKGANGSHLFWDPMKLKAEAGLTISGYSSLEVYTDQGGEIDFTALTEGAISVEIIRIQTKALNGKGGVLDLTGLSGKVFTATQKVEIYADQILTSPGVNVADLFNSPEISINTGKVARFVSLTGNSLFQGEAGSVIDIPIRVNNIATATDMYTFEVTSESGWSVGNLSTLTLKGFELKTVTLPVTLPMEKGAIDHLTIVAKSRIDSTATAEHKVIVQVTPDEIIPPNTEDTADIGLTIQDNAHTLQASEDDVETTSTSTTPEIAEDVVRVTVSETITDDGEPSVIDVEVKPNGDLKLTDPTDSIAPLLVKEDGSFIVEDEDTTVIFGTDGGFIATSATNPTQQVIMNAEDKITVTDSDAPHIDVTVHDNGEITGKDTESGTVVTKTEQDYIVTHPDFVGMQAVVNADNTLTVTDSLDPEAEGIAAIFNTLTGNYQVITADGTCYSENALQRKSFWRKVTGFVSKAARFVGKVVNKVSPIVQQIGKVSQTVSKVASFITTKAAPFINTWAGRLLGWACNNCHPFIARVASFAKNVTAANSGFLNFVGKVKTFADRVTSITNTASKVLNTVGKVATFFRFGRSGKQLRDVQRNSISTCDIWRPIKEITEEDAGTTPSTPDLGSYTAYGYLTDARGLPLANVAMTIGDQTVNTDANGYWKIDQLAEGKYTLTVAKNGRLLATQEVGLGNQSFNTKVDIEIGSSLKLIAKPETWKSLWVNEALRVGFTIVNNGSQTATGVVLTEQQPEGAEILELTASSGTCDVQTLTCQLPDLAPGASVSAQVTIGNLTPGYLKHVATLTSNEYEADKQTTWNLVKPYLSLLMLDTPDPAPIQGGMKYRAVIELSENSPITTATGVNLSFTLPKGVSLQSIDAEEGVVCDDSALPNITCQVPALSTTDDSLSSKVVIDFNVKLEDGGLLLLTMKSKLTANEHPTHHAFNRTRIYVPDDIDVDVIFVLDTTNSMQDEIDASVAAIKQFIAGLDANNPPSVVLIGFKDEVEVLAATRDMNELLVAVESLEAEGGGECPEASAEALSIALNHIVANGQIVFITDADAFPDADIEALKAAIDAKGVSVHSIITGSCHNQTSWNFATP